MELMLDNVGIIKNSLIEIDGLTVITGKNSSGKTTVGKVLYALVQANSSIDNAFEQSKAKYISSQFNKIWITLGGRRSIPFRASQFKELTDREKVLFILGLRNSGDMDSENTIFFLDAVKDLLNSLSVQEFLAFLEKVHSNTERDYAFYSTLSNQFEDRKQSAIELCSRVISTIEDPESYRVFRYDRTKALLNRVFHDQVKPIKAPRSVAKVQMIESGRTVINIRIRSKQNYAFLKDSSFVFPYNQAIFLDDPFVLDRLVPEDDSLAIIDAFLRDRENDNLLRANDIKSPRGHLTELLNSKEAENFFDDLEFQKKYHLIIEKINQIVPGEFQETEDGMFYVDNGARLNVQNLATGSKLFFIIKLLFMNGYLNKDTVLVLDEPESHLHPEWINKFAEIMVLFIKEVGLHVLLTTHSPNLLLALSVYSKTYSVSQKSHFYLAQNVDNGWEAVIKCIDEDINEGYAHLSIPLIQMSVQNEEID